MPAPRRRIDAGAALFGFAVVVAANLRYLSGLAAVVDPVLSMEPFYIDMARRDLSAIVGENPSWGPLYALWFKPLRAIFSDPLEVHAANVYVLSLAICVLLYAQTLLLTRRAAIATGAALLFLVSDFNVPLASKVCTFALMIVLAGFTLSELVARRAERLAVAAAGLLLAAYARPELYPAGLATWLVAMVSARSEMRRAPRRTALWTVGGSTILVAVAGSIGTPVWSPHHANDRLFAAFREHFAWNWQRWHGGGQFFMSTWEQEFGEAATLWQAVVANPGAVARHLADNAVGAVKLLATATFDHYPLLLPSSWSGAAAAETVALSLLAAILIALTLADGGRRRALAARCQHLLWPLAAVALFSLASAVLIFPERHYLVVPLVSLLPVLGVAVGLLLAEWSRASRWWSAAIGIACVAATPTPFVLPGAVDGAAPQFAGRIVVVRTVTDTVRKIRSLAIEPPVRVLTFTDGIGALLGAGYDEVKIWQRGEKSMRDFVLDEEIDVIVTMERGRESFLIDDPYWTLIETEPHRAGFTRVPTRDARAARIYVRSDLNVDEQ